MARGQHGDRPNFCTANVWLHGHLVTQLEKERKIANRYCQHGSTSNVITHFAWKYYVSKVPCEQCKNLERFHVNKLLSGPIFQLVENSTGTL